jgi:hypothetical protein
LTGTVRDADKSGGLDKKNDPVARATGSFFVEASRASSGSKIPGGL